MNKLFPLLGMILLLFACGLRHDIKRMKPVRSNIDAACAARAIREFLRKNADHQHDKLYTVGYVGDTAIFNMEGKEGGVIIYIDRHCKVVDSHTYFNIY